MKKILVTGSSGYIGSVLCKYLKENTDYWVIGVDLNKTTHNFLDSFIQTTFEDHNILYQLDNVDSIFHLAASADVADSVVNPLKYFDNNTAKTIVLINHLVQSKWRGNLVFSSTAATYGQSDFGVFSETDPCCPINPYGLSKLYCEEVIKTACNVHGLRASIFRYFNVAGANETVGDHLLSNHIIQKLCDSAINKKQFYIFGDDYVTRDGTCIRDYVHVIDIARAHLFVDDNNIDDYNHTYNIGSNDGTTVLELINKFEAVTGKKIKYSYGPRRSGDPRVLVANPQKLINYGFNYSYNIDDMINSSWNYYLRKTDV